MKVTNTFCDICNKNQTFTPDRFIRTEVFGDIKLTSSIPWVTNHSYEDCCYDCANAIKDAVESAIAVIRSPLNEALK